MLRRKMLLALVVHGRFLREQLRNKVIKSLFTVRELSHIKSSNFLTLANHKIQTEFGRDY